MSALILLSLTLPAQAYASSYVQTAPYAERVYYQFLPQLTPNELYGGLVAGSVRDAKEAQAAQDEIDALNQKLDKLTAAIEALQRQLAGVGSGGAPTIPPPPPPSIAPPAVVSLLQSRCAKCHTAPSGSGGLSLFDANGRFIEPDDPLVILSVEEQARFGFMPQGGPPLAKSDYEKLRDWADLNRDRIAAALKGKK